MALAGPDPLVQPRAGGTPPTGYGAPPSDYGAPPPGYDAPPPGHGAPPPGYGAPPPGYGAPPPGYGAPPPGYGAAPGYQPGFAPTTASGEVYPDWLLSKFNWGALGFGWWWALWNADDKRKWIGVGCFVLSLVSGGIPSLIFAIYVGITGNRLAATSRRFETVDQFRATQRAWALWAAILLAVSIVFGALAMVLGIFAAIVGAAAHSR